MSTEKRYEVFMAVAMEHQLPERLDFVNALVEVIEATHGPVFYAPRVWPTEADFAPPTEAFAIVEDALKASKALVLYYPDKVVSGALVELGMAISLELPVIIYTQDQKNVTYFLRGGVFNRVRLATSPADIRPWVDYTLQRLNG